MPDIPINVETALQEANELTKYLQTRNLILAQAGRAAIEKIKDLESQIKALTCTAESKTESEAG